MLFAFPIAIALAAHGLGVANGFVADDIPDILEHPVVGGSASPADVLDYNYMGTSLDDGANTLRPAATLLFAAEWAIAGNRPGVFHALSILWFLVLVIVVQRTLARFELSDVEASIGAALFASLAIHVDAVGLVANRPEICSLVFSLGCILFALDRRAGLAVACYLIALLFKESAFLTPLVVALWFALEGPRSRLRFGSDGKTVAALILAAIAFLIARSFFISLVASDRIVAADNLLVDASLATRLWMPFVLLGEYLVKALAPISLAFDYTYSAIPVEADFTRVTGWLGVVVSVGIVAAVVIGLRHTNARARKLAIAAGGFALSYALFSNSVFLIVTLFAERLFLAPSFFLVAGAMLVGAHLARRRPRARRLMMILAATVILVQTALSALRTTELRDEQTLFAAQVESQPNSVKGHFYLSRVLAKKGESDLALWHLAIASLGRKQFPAPFKAPRRSELPIEEDLTRLPALLGDGASPNQFWSAFARFAGRTLGPHVEAAAARAGARVPGHP